jgi:hypothetical protein
MEMFIPRVHTKHEDRRATPVFASLGALTRVKGAISVKSGENPAKE